MSSSTYSYSLKSFNTFAIDAMAKQQVIASSVIQLRDAWQHCQDNNQPFLLIGAGSNILFLEDFAGTVVVNQLKGISITDSEQDWHIHCAAGENWHQLVETLLEKGIAGLENMALIPGMTGSSPIQNIGAYGVELKDRCEYVDILDLAKGEQHRLTAEQCQFGYRDSIFKHHYQYGYAITGVGFKLAKNWQPVLDYGELSKLDKTTVTPRQIFDLVCAIRRNKLPDPSVYGNAGSFFKNPVISSEQLSELLKKYPQMPHYLQAGGGIKLAAGWLIDQCDLKGFTIGGAMVHRQQALVLINTGNATADDIIALARHIRISILSRFGVVLEPEVRFISGQGEVDATEIIA